MSDDLAAYLDSVDAHLVQYLDASRDLSSDAIHRVQCYSVALVQGLVVPEHVHEDWPDFFPLSVAFVLAHGSARLGHLARRSAIFEGGGDETLTDADRAFLVTLLAEMHELVCRREK